MPYAATYKGTYEDARGVVAIDIANDGQTLQTAIRGVEFSGTDFDSLSPIVKSGEVIPPGFTLVHGALAECKLSVSIPIPIVVGLDEEVCDIQMELELGRDVGNGRLDEERLRLVLKRSGIEIQSSGVSGWFEDELLDLERQLLGQIYIKSCFFCLYSDYSPYGHRLFGGMMCFRNIKAEYLRVRSKDDFWTVHDRCEREVQETFLCGDFARRIPGTGYRG